MSPSHRSKIKLQKSDKTKRRATESATADHCSGRIIAMNLQNAIMCVYATLARSCKAVAGRRWP